ncbi:hypothetical protein SCA6_002062 [Theobroma cacao]
MAKKELLVENGEEVCRADFSPSFVFGVATSAYQIEGACNEGSRGASIWDSFSRTEGKIVDGSTGDVAVDHYHRYKVHCRKELLSDLNSALPHPYGLGTRVNDEGITFYNNLIDALLEKGIQPYVTLYHWDLPLHLHESIGGWLNKQIVSPSLASAFGAVIYSVLRNNFPVLSMSNVEDTNKASWVILTQSPSDITGNILLRLEIRITFFLLLLCYQDKQGGQIGLVLDCEWAEANSDKIEDKSAAARRLDFQLGWYMCPLYYGDYPAVMRERIGDRLPKFSQEEKELLGNSLDFIGLNHYTSRFIAHVNNGSEESFFYRAQEMERTVEWEGGEKIGEKAASEWLYVVPWGIRKVLNYIAQTYSNLPIYVTENGMDDEENKSLPLHEILDDKLRVRYFKGYLAAVAQAIKDGADVRGYFAWSLLDNFEWAQGYTKRFGLVYVDYKNGLTRHPKSSAYWFSRFLKGGEKKSGKED